MASAQGTRAARAGRGGVSPGLRVTLTCSATGTPAGARAYFLALSARKGAQMATPHSASTRRGRSAPNTVFSKTRAPGPSEQLGRSRIAVCAASFTEVDAVLQGPDPCLHQLARRKAGFITCCLA